MFYICYNLSMEIGLLLFFVFLFGAIVGSFLNVVALRYGTGMKAVKGRSRCFSCGKTLHWSELVPIISFAWLRGKCAGCKSKISWQYPIIEFLTGVLFVATFINLYPLFALTSIYFLLSFVLVSTIWSILVVILIYDIKHKIIPDPLVFSFIIVSVLKLILDIYFLKNYSVQSIFFDVMAGPIFFVPFFLLWFISKGKWIGFGDGKLSLGIGIFLGLSKGLSAITVGFWSGAILGILFIILSKTKVTNRLFLPIKRFTMKSEVPFAPFLIFGSILAYFFNLDIFGIVMLMNF